jgi:uncharacterized hydrophobic protein (TIGR00271 family)
MMHLQLVVPTDRTDQVLATLRSDDSVANLGFFPGAAVSPEGAVVVCDVAREGTHAVVARLRELGLEDDGAIMLTEPTTVLSAAAVRAEQAAPGLPDDGLVWDVVQDRVTRDSELSFAYLAFLVLAVLIAGAGRLLDQPILIVGAMVVGPEFSSLAAICVALTRPALHLLPQGIRTLVLGFVVAILAAVPFWWVVRLTGHASEAEAASGNLTSFIVQPDGWSFVIALLAGVAGTIALTTAKSGPLVGVFISVTTVPAAGTIALCVGTGVWSEVGPAALQLGINLVGILLAGTVTLFVQRTFWRRVGAHATDIHG